MADAATFDELYQSSRDRLVVQIAALTGDPSEALDFVQEAFVRAWARWDRISTYDDPEGWVRRVAYRLAVGRWRRSRRLVLRKEVARPPVAFPEEQMAVIDALKVLSANERAAIVLHHLVGLPVEEVAIELQAPSGTVKSWLHRGRQHLAAVLQEGTADGIGSSTQPNGLVGDNPTRSGCPRKEIGHGRR